jgi:hypothetical protein
MRHTALDSPLDLPMSKLVLTWIGIAAAVLIGGVAVYMERRPYVPGKVWYVPYRAVMLVCVLAFILAAAHLITLYTGYTLPDRRPR